MDKYRAYKFLASLKQEFDQVRIQILSKDEISLRNEAITIVLAEESRRDHIRI